ncbi:MAG: ATP-grasp domain-containing protein, partial [Gammaproteobacteria bacterium]|nr:ATP-grasp domain-containing protein [Gammaproteobacteria bacterium]
MAFKGVLIANRGEIAIRIARACADMGIRSVAVYSEDDASSLHCRMADVAWELTGKGAKAYLDMEAIIEAAIKNDCDAIHPGYGFLSEQAEFAQKCVDAGVTFIGPKVEQLALFGDKARARAAALASDVPLLKGMDHAVSLEEARSFFEASGGSMIIKAVAGGGGRGTSAVTRVEEIESVYERCQREAKAAFGVADVYVEEFIPMARHVEVQVLGDCEGRVIHLWERECSVQRRNQKVLEIAPAPNLAPALRDEIIAAAMRFAEKQRYFNLGTFEFLVDVSGRKGAQPFVFIEANARLQVEHTVTEAVTGVDLVQTQIRLAEGQTLAELGLSADEPPLPSGFAVQARVNMEVIKENGAVRPGGGTFVAYDAPGGPGIRTDGFGYSGYKTSSAFDSLLAKVIVHSASKGLEQVVNRAIRALSEFRIEGVSTNIPFLQNILAHEDFLRANIHTRWVDEQIKVLAAPFARPERYVSGATKGETATEIARDGFAGARVDTSDPLALFAHDAEVKASRAMNNTEPDGPDMEGPDGSIGLTAPIQGTIVAIDVSSGDEVVAGQQVAVVEAMKMEHVIVSEVSGIVRQVTMVPGDVVREGWPIVYVEESEVAGSEILASEQVDPDYIRPDLAEAYARHAYTLDENRKEAVEKRRARGYRMPRENIAELVDEDSFKEYWPLIVARQHRRFDIDALRRNTPADGLIAGTCTINADLFGEEAARAMVVHYDYTVLAGTQGARNHYKQDRMFDLAKRFQLPLVLFGEGGG